MQIFSHLTIQTKAISCVFLCFASVQNCETFQPAGGKNKQTLKNKKQKCLNHQQRKYSTKSKHRKWSDYLSALQNLFIHNTIT
jgi:predicted solute-binding protein